MRKTAWIAGGLVAAAVAGWSGLWAAGRSEVASRLDAEVARLAARGIEVSHGGREIGGYPLGYEVALTDVAVRDGSRGLSASLPRLTGRVEATDTETLVFEFPPVFAAAVEARGETLPLEVESEGLTLVLSGAPSGPREARLAAASVLVVAADPEREGNGAVELVALDAKATVPAAGAGGEATLEARIGRVDVLLADQEGAEAASGRLTRVDATVDDVFVTGSAAGADTALLLAAIAGGAAVPRDGRVALEMRAGLSRGGIAVSGAPDSGALTLETREIRGSVTVRDGNVASAAESRALRLEILPESAEARVRGALGIAQLELGHVAPGLPDEAMGPLSLRVVAEGIAPGDALWQSIDPAGRLPREPARLALDLEGTARLLPAEAGGALPVEIGNLIVEEAAVAALGARIAAAGALEFAQPLNQPTGTITVTLTDTMPAVASLVSAGLVEIATAQTVMMLAESYTRPGATPEELVAEIGFSTEGVTVNGALLMPAP